jgi:epoxyqueuosine reductase
LVPNLKVRGQDHLGDVSVPPALRSVPGTPKDHIEEAYYNFAYPEGDFGTESPVGRAFGALNQRRPERQQIMERWGQLQKDLNARMHEVQNLPPTGPRSKKDITLAIKAEARHIGFDVVGVARFDRTHIYANYRTEVLRYPSVVVVGTEYPLKEFAAKALTVQGSHDSHRRRLEHSERALQLADFIRAQGYRVQMLAGAVGFSLVKELPYAEAAGLGQLGANGQLLSPYFGSRWYPFVMSTEARLTYDHPQDFGINRLCEECKICIRRCPGRAIPKTRIHWRGVYKHKIQSERCIPMLLRYNTCNVCTLVCPVQKFGLSAVLDHYEKTGGAILGKDTDALEGYTLPDKGHFGPGQMPRFTRDEARMHYELLSQSGTVTDESDVDD